MLSGNCTEASSIQANVTISGSSAKLIKNGIAPLPFPPRAAKAILVHQARGEGQGEGTCSILCNVRVSSQTERRGRPHLSRRYIGKILSDKFGGWFGIVVPASRSIVMLRESLNRCRRPMAVTS